jgi:hypothetical protein
MVPADVTLEKNLPNSVESERAGIVVTGNAIPEFHPAGFSQLPGKFWNRVACFENSTVLYCATIFMHLGAPSAHEILSPQFSASVSHNAVSGDFGPIHLCG